MKDFRLSSRLVLGALLTLALSPLVNAQAAIAGDWAGSLGGNGPQFRMVLHIAAAANGNFTATVDIPDHDVVGIPVTSVNFQDSKLSLGLDAFQGGYDGTINKDGTEIKGLWTRDEPVEMDFKRVPAQSETAAKPVAPSDVDGSWSGILDAGQAKLNLTLKITTTQAGLTARLQLHDLGSGWVLARSVTRTGNSFTASFAGVGAEFSGKISPDLTSIDGNFSQGGKMLPLALKRQAEPTKP